MKPPHLEHHILSSIYPNHMLVDGALNITHMSFKSEIIKSFVLQYISQESVPATVSCFQKNLQQQVQTNFSIVNKAQRKLTVSAYPVSISAQQTGYLLSFLPPQSAANANLTKTLNPLWQGEKFWLWTWNVEKNQIDCSAKLQKLIGLPANKTTMTIEEFLQAIHPDEKEDVWDILQAHLIRSFEYDVEFRLKCADDTYIWVKMQGETVRDHENKASVMGAVIFNISDFKYQIDRLSFSNKNLERFAYVCSHDIKEPARVMENFAEILVAQYPDIDPAIRKHLLTIQKYSKRLKNIVLGVLHYSKIKNKK